jgi:hypothetical protein
VTRSPEPLATLLLLALLATPDVPRAAPDPVAGTAALLATPFEVTGDLLGGAGLIGAALVAGVGDVVALADRNRVTEPLLRGAVSRTVQTLAFALSWSTTRGLELLRRQNVERLPEPFGAYVDVAPFAGRFDTARSGVAALGLALRDSWSGPTLAAAHLVGASGTADALAQGRHEARVRALGPDPLAPSS